MSSVSFRRFTQEDLIKLNSATKYPSIPTYHAMGDKGRLTETLTTEFTGPIWATEKIDGTNTRIIVSPDPRDGLILGSREELLHYTDDLVRNPSQSIVTTLYNMLSRGAEPTSLTDDSRITVIYGEVYGGKVTAASKQYTASAMTAFRVFDIAYIAPEILDSPADRIASWRDHGGQYFADAYELDSQVGKAGLDLVPSLKIPLPPVGLENTLAWLETWVTVSGAMLDSGAGGRPEGVVVRNADRTAIAKIRLEDYRRTSRGRK